MNRINHGANANRDTAALCYGRAAADRVLADGTDTHNGRRKFEASAASWQERGDLLGRLEASFEKRRLLEVASTQFAAAKRAEGVLHDSIGVLR